MAAKQASIGIKFRLPDGNDIGPNKYAAGVTVTALKEHVIEQWPKDKENGPKTIKDVRLIYSGRILENHRTLAESRLPVGDIHAGDITVLVVLRPPVPEGNTDNQLNDDDGPDGCQCSIL